MRFIDLIKFSVARVKNNVSNGTTTIVGPDSKDIIVIAATAPVNSDNRPDGTIYIQTTS